MNAALLLEHYDQIADAADAIVRLRQFVRDLAVRGKLVGQHPNEEPASELLKKLPEAKDRLLQEGKASRALTKPLRSPVDRGDYRPGWVSVDAAELFPTRSGNSKLIKGKLHAQPGDGLYPGYSAAGQDVWLNDWEHDGIAIILSAIGARCGKAFLATGRWSAIANTHIIWLLPDITYPPFAMLHLNNELFWQRSGGAQPFVKVAATLARPFSLPPFAEQKRIVEKFDKMMVLCDELEGARLNREVCRDQLTTATLARLIEPSTETFVDDVRFAIDNFEAISTRREQIQVLQHAIVSLAMRGKIVEQDPREGDASDLLQEISAENSRLAQPWSMPGFKPQSEANKGEADYPIPASWSWVPLGQVVKLWNGYAFKSADFGTAGVPVVRIGNLQNGAVNLEGAARVSEEVASQISDNFWIPNGALLLAMSGATTGKTAFNTTGRKLLLNQRVAMIEPVCVDIRFLKHFFDTIVSRNLEISFGTAIPNLSSQQINSTLIPLPPLGEQQRIVARLGELIGSINQLQQSLAHTELVRTSVLSAVLHHSLEMA